MCVRVCTCAYACAITLSRTELFYDQCIKNAISEDSALLSIESIGMKVSMDLMDSQKAPSFEFVGENFGR